MAGKAINYIIENGYIVFGVVFIAGIIIISSLFYTQKYSFLFFSISCILFYELIYYVIAAINYRPPIIEYMNINMSLLFTLFRFKSIFFAVVKFINLDNLVRLAIVFFFHQNHFADLLACKVKLACFLGLILLICIICNYIVSTKTYIMLLIAPLIITIIVKVSANIVVSLIETIYSFDKLKNNLLTTKDTLLTDWSLQLTSESVNKAFLQESKDGSSIEYPKKFDISTLKSFEFPKSVNVTDVLRTESDKDYSIAALKTYVEFFMKYNDTMTSIETKLRFHKLLYFISYFFVFIYFLKFSFEEAKKFKDEDVKMSEDSTFDTVKYIFITFVIVHILFFTLPLVYIFVQSVIFTIYKNTYNVQAKSAFSVIIEYALLGKVQTKLADGGDLLANLMAFMKNNAFNYLLNIYFAILISAVLTIIYMIYNRSKDGTDVEDDPKKNAYAFTIVQGFIFISFTFLTFYSFFKKVLEMKE